MHERIVTVGGLPTRVLTAGDSGPVLILLHGGFCDTASLSWGAMLADLGRFARVFAPDLPGYGGTPLPAETPTTLSYYGDFVARFTAALGHERAIYAGISMGGMIALELTFARPELAESLALIGTGGLTSRFPRQRLSYLLTRNLAFYERVLKLGVGSRGQIRRALGKMFHGREHVTEELVTEIAGILGRGEAFRAFGHFGRDLLTPEGVRTCFMPRLHELTQRVAVIHGEHDYFYPVHLAEEAHRRLRHSRLEIAYGCGHWVTRERPELVAKLLREMAAGA